MRIIILFCLFVFLHGTANSGSIRGQISDDKGQALISATVHIIGTTKGSIANFEGNYKVDSLKEGIYKIVASYVGYKKQEISLYLQNKKDTVINFSLLKDETELKAIVVNSSRDREWDRQLTRFKKLFFGDDYGSDKLTIENPEVLSFNEDYIENKRTLTATAEAPLIINNRKTGYRIYVSLNSFDYNTKILYYNFDYFFEELEAANEKEKQLFIQNRRKVYTGSLRHFLKSLYSFNHENNGFKIYECQKNIYGSPSLSSSSAKLKADSLLIEIRDSELKMINFPEVIKIAYDNGDWLTGSKISALEYIQPGQAYINKDGFLFDMNRRIIVNGYWATMRIGAALPMDYEPFPDY